MGQSEKSTTSLPFRNFFINSYILPGFLFLLASIIACYVFRSELPSWMYFRSAEFNGFIENYSIADYLNKDTAFSVELLLLAVLLFISLILGNAISVVGGLLFDTLWLGKGIGWPYERILSFYPKDYTRRAFYIAIFTALNLSSIFYICGWLYDLKTVLFIILIVYGVRDFFITQVYFRIYGNDEDIKSFLKSISENKRYRVFESLFVYLRILKNKYQWNWFWSVIVYIITFAFCFDIAILLAIILGKFFGLSKGLGSIDRKKFKKKYKKIFDLDNAPNSTEIYWKPYIYLSKHNPENIRIANSHLKRSILLRNLAAAGVIVLFILLSLKPNGDADFVNRWQKWTGTWYIASYLLFIGYNLILHKYYTKYLIRSFIISHE